MLAPTPKNEDALLKTVDMGGSFSSQMEGKQIKVLGTFQTTFVI